MPKEIRQPEQKLNSEPQPIDTTSCPNIGNTNVMCSLLSCDKEKIEFGLMCYNDGLYDGQLNIKGGESIIDKFQRFKMSIK